MSELNKCPFCGEERAYSVMLQGETWIKCNCGVQFSARPYKNMVFDTWNNRPIEELLRKRIEELERRCINLTSSILNAAQKEQSTTIIAEMEARYEKTAAWLRKYCDELYAEIKRLRKMVEELKKAASD